MYEKASVCDKHFDFDLKLWTFCYLNIKALNFFKDYL